MGHGKLILQAPKSLKKRVRLMANKRSFFQKDHCRRMLADWCLNGSFSLAKRSCPWHFVTGRQGLVEILARNSWVSLLPFCIFSQIFSLFFTAKLVPNWSLSGRHTVAVLRSASKRPRVQTPANEIACRSTVQHRSTCWLHVIDRKLIPAAFSGTFPWKSICDGV